ncbi:Uma2 family endonuclease [bacterium]|nr:MAG: Uma2 family endonuclease [bacterium]
MSAQPEHILDFDELLAFEAASPIRHEYIGGKLYAMAGGTITHARTIANLTAAVQAKLWDKPCGTASGDLKVRTSETARNWYYPDLTIVCPPIRTHPSDEDSLLNPHAIFEVLSPATAEFDRTGKFDEYQLIPEFSDYILVSVDRVRIEHFWRVGSGDWTHRVYRLLSQELQLQNFGISVPLSQIYKGIEVAEQGVLPGMEES